MLEDDIIKLIFQFENPLWNWLRIWELMILMRVKYAIRRAKDDFLFFRMLACHALYSLLVMKISQFQLLFPPKNPCLIALQFCYGMDIITYLKDKGIVDNPWAFWPSSLSYSPVCQRVRIVISKSKGAHLFVIMYANLSPSTIPCYIYEITNH